MRTVRRSLLAFLAVFFCLAGMGVVVIARGQVPDACVTVKGPGDSGVFVNLSDDVTPESVQHIREAWERGQPKLLHWDPSLADAHRRASLKGVSTAPGKDRDEYPPAAAREGGAGADVRLIGSSDNRSAGQRLGAVMRPYCDGQAFTFLP